MFIVGMRNFHDNFKTPKRSFISAFSICMTVPLTYKFAGEQENIQNTLHTEEIISEINTEHFVKNYY